MNAIDKEMLKENEMDDTPGLVLPENHDITEELAASYKKVLQLIGEDPGREGLLKTPDRVAKAIQYLTHGYDLNPEEILRSAMFKEDYKQMV
ncbi:MAG TPA: GTP cyclohydrolase I, partial [Bacteroidales bacterium]|nr:GTP cyclohydrolase I [Bacteroidales bacterium]